MTTKEDDRVDRRKISAYQRLVSTLSAEKHAIEEYGTFSFEAHEADDNTAKARRNYELWRKK